MSLALRNSKSTNIMKRNRISIVALLAITLILSSCSNKDHPKKCNGNRGTKVPMGVI